MATLEDLHRNIRSSIDFVRGVGNLQMSSHDRLIVEMNSVLANVIDGQPELAVRESLQSVLELIPIEQQDLGTSMKDVLHVNFAKTFSVAVNLLLQKPGGATSSAATVKSSTSVTDKPATLPRAGTRGAVDGTPKTGAGIPTNFSVFTSAPSARATSVMPPTASGRNPRGGLNCTYCGKHTNSITHQTRHQMEEHPEEFREVVLAEGGVECSLEDCLYVSRRLDGVRLHIRRNHKSRAAFLLELLDKSVARKRPRPKNSATPGVAPVGERTPLFGGLQHNRKMHDEEDERNDVENGGHEEEEEDGGEKEIPVHRCTACGRTFTSGRGFANHMRTKCSSAMKNARYSLAPPSMRQRRGGVVVGGETPAAKSRILSLLRRAVSEVRQEPVAEEAPAEALTDSGQATLVCEGCGRFMNSRKALLAHTNKMHPDLYYNKFAVFKCDEPGCMYAAAHDSTMKKHFRMKHRRNDFLASNTTATLNEADTTGDIDNSMEWSATDTGEGGSAPVKEEVPDDGGSSASGSANRPLRIIDRCTKCSARFPSYSAFRTHVTTAHPSDDDILYLNECHHCPKTFATAEQLTVHINKSHVVVKSEAPVSHAADNAIDEEAE